MQTALPFFGIIRVSGEERALFLNGQLSNDINKLADNQACYATYNSPQGRVLANMMVVNQNQALYLVMANDLVETIAKRLKMFVLRSKVQIDVLNDWGVSGSLNDDAEPVLPTENPLTLTIDHVGNIVLPHSGSLNIAPKHLLPAYQAEHEQAWQQHEIQSGYPWISAQSSGAWVAQMLNQHHLGAIHFRKGCYVGQEVIARAQYRGQVKRGLALAKHSKTLPTNSKIYNQQQQEAGEIVNSCHGWHLLVLKHPMAQAPLLDEESNAFVIQHLFFDVVNEDVGAEK